MSASLQYSDLKTICENLYYLRINTKNAFKVLEVLDKYGNQDLIEKLILSTNLSVDNDMKKVKRVFAKLFGGKKHKKKGPQTGTAMAVIGQTSPLTSLDIPFVSLSTARTWTDGAKDGVNVILANGDQAMLKNLKARPVTKDAHCLQVFRLQSPQTQKFTVRVLHAVQIAPPNVLFISLPNPSFPVVQYTRAVSTGERSQRIQEFSLDQAFFDVPRDPPRNLEEEHEVIQESSSEPTIADTCGPTSGSMSSSDDCVFISHFCWECDQVVDHLAANSRCPYCNSRCVTEMSATGGRGGHPLNENIDLIDLTSVLEDTVTAQTLADTSLPSTRESVINCTICFDTLNDNGVREERSLDCGHRFHSECVEHWLTQSQTCPLCRARVDPEADVTTSVGQLQHTQELVSNTGLVSHPIPPMMATNVSAGAVVQPIDVPSGRQSRPAIAARPADGVAVSVISSLMSIFSQFVL